MSENSNWKHLVPKEILEKGLSYYQEGKAKRAVEGQDGFETVVRGRRNYKVFIHTNPVSGMVKSIDCSCDEPKEKNWCHHMAAAMLLVENIYGPLSFENPLEEEEIKRAKVPAKKNSPNRSVLSSLDEIQSIEKLQREEIAKTDGQNEYQPDEAYRYFHFESYLKDLHVSMKEIKEARDVLKGEHSDLKVKIGFDPSNGAQGMLGECSLSDSDTYYSYFGWRTRIVFGPKRILESSCSNYACMTKTDAKSILGHSLCRHQVAAILLLQDYLRDNNPGDDTNLAGITLLGRAQEGMLGTTDAVSPLPAEIIHIEPVLTVEENDKIRAGFRIGSSRMYKIKSITRTVENIRTHTEETFGKNTTLKLGREYIAQDCLPVLEFLENLVDEDEEISQRFQQSARRYYDTPELPKLGGDVMLFGDRLDRFFEIMLGKRAEITFKDLYDKNKKTYLFQDKDFLPQLEIRKNVDGKTGIFQGIEITGDMPEIFAGRRNSYYFSEDCFNRLSEERTKNLTPLLSSASGGYLLIRVGRNHMADFYHKTLPRLKELADIIEYDLDEIAIHLPPEPSFVCYLDYQDDTIYCRGEAVYGPQVFSLTDRLDIESNPSFPFASYRDKVREGDILSLILPYLSNYDHDNHILYGTREEMAVFEFLSVGLNELMKAAEVRATERFKRLKVRRAISFNMGVSVDANLMDLTILSEDVSKEELLDILFGYRQKRRFLRLKNGDFIKLDQNESIAQLSQMLDTLHIPLKDFVKGKMQLPAYRALYLDKMLEMTQGVYTQRDVHFRNLVKEFKTVEDADFDPPMQLQSVLRKYQLVGYRWLRTLDQFHFGGILADEMGLGKTLQAIAVLLAVYQEEDEKSSRLPSMIICPASLVFNWGEELAKFAPQLKVLLISGTQGERKKMIAKSHTANVLVTSYDLLKRDIDLYEDKEFRFAVIDEAQYIKNHTTAAAKSTKLIRARTKFALTGTPIENRLSELWSIFDFLMPGFLYEYEYFRTNFEMPVVKNQDREAQEQLMRMVTPFILRRRKEDVLKDLPDKLEELRYAKMGAKQQKVYDGQVVKMKTRIVSQDEAQFRRSKIEILAELTRIRQICCDPELLFEDYSGGSAKREACIELVMSLAEGGHKALVFSQFTSMLELLEEDLKKEGLSYYKITGATPKEKRLAMVKSFNEDETPVFLISLRAGGTGLNLVGADAVIHYDPWWNLAVQNQATDRAHRIGQTKVVTVYKLIVKGTIEEKIVEMQESKKQLAEEILSGEGIGSGSLNKEDLLALLE